ncbi:hypothetical protein FPQ18DRAFT_266644, partial [Pyronema domesticum]
IITVPGLGAHAFGTWKASNGYKMWLRDFSPDRNAMQDTRILLYGYNPSIDNSTLSDSLDDYAKRILLLLNKVRKKQQERRRPLIFVCHCLGGLVVKKALANAGVLGSPDHEILTSCVALLFFGVPNQGLEVEDLLSVVRGQQNARLVEDLRISSALLRAIHEDFVTKFESIRNCQVISFYESKDSPAIMRLPNGDLRKNGRLVSQATRESATQAIPGERFHNQIPMNVDHSAIVKYDEYDSGNFIIVRGKLEDCIKGAEVVMKSSLDGGIILST